MARQQIVLNRVVGIVQGYVLAFLIAENRMLALKRGAEYQHKTPERDTIPFVRVYDTDVTDRLGSGVSKDEAFPEGELKFAVVERIIILEDTNPKEEPRDRMVKAVVLVRKHYLPAARRLFVQAEWSISGHENIHPLPGKTIVRDFNQPNPDDLEVARTLGDF